MIDCKSTTLAIIKKHKLYTSVDGRSSMNKAELCKALNKAIKSEERKVEKSKKAKKPVKKISPKKESPVRSKTPVKIPSPKKVSPKKVPTILNYLPTEIHEKILLEAEPKTLLDACYTNKEALKMCSTDGFWERYYKKHKMEFKPWNYDIGGRIKTARMNLMRLMTVAELRKECNSDKQAQAICESNKFWENYRSVYLREGSSKQKLKSAEMDELLSKSKNIKNSKIYAKITDLAAFKKIILYVDKAKLSDDHKNRIYDFLKNTDYIYVGITQPGRGSFHYNLYDKNKMNIFIFASTYSTFWEIFDIMKNIKVDTKL